MVRFSIYHILAVVITFAVLAVACVVIRKLNRRWQNAVFILVTLIGSLGIFFRYAMSLKWTADFQWFTLAEQMMQVCNFNMILLPLMLIPKNELARQYSFMFSMWGAMTTYLSIPKSWSTLEWNDIVIVNFWLNHTMAVALPVLMWASGRLKPQKKYILPVLACVFAYFTVSAVITKVLLDNGTITIEQTHSFLYSTDGIALFELFYKLIPYPYFYLYPMLPLLAGFFWLQCFALRRQKVQPYTLVRN